MPLRCFISSKGQDKRINCRPNGDIIASDNRKAYEEWLIVRCSDETTFKLQNRAHGKYLILDSCGHISTSGNIPNEEGQWKLIKQSPNEFSFLICATYGESQRQLSCSGQEDGISAISQKEKEQQDKNDCQVWHIELLSGELCFLSSPAQNKRLSCHPWSGKLSMSSNWKGWEVWRLIEAGNGHVRISNWTHQDKFLCSDGNGTVWTTDNHIGSWETWDVERTPDGSNGVVLRSVSHGRFLKAAVDGSPVSTSPTFDGMSTTWQTDAGHGQSFYISSFSQDTRIGCSKSDVYSTNNRKAWEVWEMKQQANGSVSLYSRAHGKNLGSDPHGSLYVTEELGEDEMWELSKIWEDGFVMLGLKSYLCALFKCCMVF